jgi:hypothetical protein
MKIRSIPETIRVIDSSSQPLTNQALERLRKLGEGNGLAPDAIELIESHEDVYAVDAHIRLTPMFNVEGRSYAGSIKGKNVMALPGFVELQEDVNGRKEAFQKSDTWLQDALKELKESHGHGWGHDGGKIILSEQNVTLAANEKCPVCASRGLVICEQCQGQTTVRCTYCQGLGQENCYHCLGKGIDPVYPQQPCTICRGTLFAPCRYCNARGQVPCPMCQAKGGTPCPACQGAGSVTQEAAITAGAEIHFQVATGSELPSALLRSLDRLGMINLPKGHAGIDLIEPGKDASETEKNTFLLRAKIPFAEMKLRLMDKTVMVSAFGKHGRLGGLPPFLDQSLRPWRERLARAARGTETIDKALKARAMREALALVLSGKNQAGELRRLYPVGLTAETAKEIMNNMGLALRRMTLRARTIVAAVSLAASAGLFAALLLTPLRIRLAHSLPPKTLLLIETFLPVAAMSLSAYAFAHVVRWILIRRFPKMDVRFGHNIGKLGYGTLVCIVLIYALIFALTKFT